VKSSKLNTLKRRFTEKKVKVWLRCRKGYTRGTQGKWEDVIDGDSVG
jgi:hypothetical protein